jgi:type I restriction enzyme M protein
MFEPHIKKNVDKLWKMFWSAGLTNPLVAIEQITYLLFLKRLEGLDNERVRHDKRSIYEGVDGCRWSELRQTPTGQLPEHLNKVVFPWLRELESRLAQPDTPTNGIEAVDGRMRDAYFQLDPNKAAILQEAIALIDKLFGRVDTAGGVTDIMGDTFEYLLSEISTAGKNGQFRTPRHIIRFMVALLEPKPGDWIIDPAAGTGGFLFSSLSHILKRHSDPESLRIEWDGTPQRVQGE